MEIATLPSVARNDRGRIIKKTNNTGVIPMKNRFKIAVLSICILLIPFSAVHASISDSTYFIFVKGPVELISQHLNSKRVIH